MTENPSDFWSFAGGAWAHTDLRERLLRGQDRYDLDVILFLFVCWYPHRLPAAQWAAVQRTAETPNAHTRRIRRLRRRIKRLGWPEGYRACLDLELHAERLEARALMRATPGTTPPSRAAPSPPRSAPPGVGTPSTAEPAPPSTRTPPLDRRLARLFPELSKSDRRDLLEALQNATRADPG